MRVSLRHEGNFDGLTGTLIDKINLTWDGLGSMFQRL
jgi:hypothetical protein